MDRKDGEQIVFTITSDRHWQNFYRAVARPDSAVDGSHATNNQRIAARERLRPILGAIAAAVERLAFAYERPVAPWRGRGSCGSPASHGHRSPPGNAARAGRVRRRAGMAAGGRGVDGGTIGRDASPPGGHPRGAGSFELRRRCHRRLGRARRGRHGRIRTTAEAA
ncbi:MAG: CoA transferase [Alphaproteobacteria bacterium]